MSPRVCPNLYRRWPELPRDQKRQIVETITDRITVGKEDIDIFLHYVPTGIGPDGPGGQAIQPGKPRKAAPPRMCSTSPRRNCAWCEAELSELGAYLALFQRHSEISSRSISIENAATFLVFLTLRNV